MKTSPDKPKTKVLLVEDERIVALDLAHTLTELGYGVAASVSTGEAGVQQATQLRPDLVIMDIRLSGAIDGIEAAQRIRQQIDVPVIYLTAHSDDVTLARAKDTEPFGYLVKPFRAPELHCAIEIALHRKEIESQLRHDQQKLVTLQRDATEAVLAAVRRVLNSEIDVSPRITERMLRPHFSTTSPDPAIAALSARELEVFRLVGEGLATKKIAEQLKLSAKTIEAYQAHIKKKLSLSTSRELIQRAIQWTMAAKRP